MKSERVRTTVLLRSRVVVRGWEGPESKAIRKPEDLPWEGDAAFRAGLRLIGCRSHQAILQASKEV